MPPRLSLLSLPFDIRYEILKACICMAVRPHDFRTFRQITPLLQTCRVIYNEAVDVFDNHDLAFELINDLYRFLRCIRRRRRQRVRRLSFRYYVASGAGVGQAKWEDLELIQRTFRLMQRECTSLERLTIRISEGVVLRDLGVFWNKSIYYPHPSVETHISYTYGLKELARLRGLQKVKFLSYWSEFSEETKEILEGVARAMMTKKEVIVTRKMPNQRKGKQAA